MSKIILGVFLFLILFMALCVAAIAMLQPEDQEDDELTEEELKELEDSKVADAGHLADDLEEVKPW